VHEAVNLELKGKRTKTKHSGFFVNAGDLELVETPLPGGRAGGGGGGGGMDVDSDEGSLDGGGLLMRANSNGSSSSGGGGKGEGGDRHRNPRIPRPQWQPNEVARKALLDFKNDIAANLGNKPLGKNKKIPLSLEGPLRKCDDIVMREHSGMLKKTSGYYEELAAHLGGNIAIGSIRNYIRQFRKKDEAKVANLELESRLLQLKQLIVKNTHSIVDGGGGGGEEEEEAGGDASSAQYKWYVRWDLNMRQLLVRCEGLVTSWVNKENTAREGMRKEERDKLPESEKCVVVDKDEQLNMLRAVLSFFPAECKNADANALRKQMNTEKNRVKKKAKQEEEAKNGGGGGGDAAAGEKEDGGSGGPFDGNAQKSASKGAAAAGAGGGGGGGGHSSAKLSPTKMSLAAASKAKPKAKAATKAAAGGVVVVGGGGSASKVGGSGGAVWTGEGVGPPIGMTFNKPPKFNENDFVEVGREAADVTQEQEEEEDEQEEEEEGDDGDEAQAASS